MRKHTLLLFMLFAGTIHGGDKFGWRDSSDKLLADTTYRKVMNDFAGELLVTSDSDWEAKWKTSPETIPSFNVAHTAMLGQELFILTFFANPKMDSQGNAHVICNIKVTRPDGSVSVDQKDIECLNGKLEGAQENIRLSPAIIKFTAEK